MGLLSKARKAFRNPVKAVVNVPKNVTTGVVNQVRSPLAKPNLLGPNDQVKRPTTNAATGINLVPQAKEGVAYAISVPKQPTVSEVLSQPAPPPTGIAGYGSGGAGWSDTQGSPFVQADGSATAAVDAPAPSSSSSGGIDPKTLKIALGIGAGLLLVILVKKMRH